MSAPSPPPDNVPAAPAATASVPPPPAAPARPRKRRSFLRRLMVLVVLLLLGIAALPTMIARTGARHHLFVMARPGLPDGVTIGEATINWFSPIVFRHVTIPDLSGQPLLVAKEIRTDRPLWELMARPNDIGRITLIEPDIRLVATGGRLNLQLVLDRLAKPSAPPSRPRVRVECRGGKLTVTDEAGQLLLACASIDGVYDDLRQGTTPVTATLTAQTTVPTTAGRLDLSAEWTPPHSSTEVIGPGHLQVTATDWPLDPLLPVLRERIGARGLAGQTTVGLQSRWEALRTTGGRAELDVQMRELQAMLQPADAGAPPLQVQTRDAGVHLAGEYDGTADRLTLRESRVQSEWVSGALSGTLSELRGRCLCDVSGELRLSLETLQRLLPPGALGEVTVEGLETRRIALRGALRPATGEGAGGPALAEGNAHRPVTHRGATVSHAGVETGPLAIETELVWKLLEAYGIASTDAVVQLSYSGGRLETTPTRVPVSGGRVGTVPSVEWSAPGTVLTFSEGQMLEQIAFNETLCRGWMRYLSPLMANATSVEGTFSLAVDPGQVAVSNWSNSGLTGTLAIHSARVGPGPLTQQILGVVGQIRAIAERRGPLPGDAPSGERLSQWLTITDQQVRYAVRDGRVYHERLQLYVGPVSVESQGSVGIPDDSLDLLLRIRFPEAWFANRPLLAHLRGEGLLIPIRGTLAQPQVESRPLLEFGRGIGLRAADELLQRLRDR